MIDFAEKKPKHAHPATLPPTRWIWHNRQDEPPEMQIIDLLTDIRNLVLLILFVSFF